MVALTPFLLLWPRAPALALMLRAAPLPVSSSTTFAVFSSCEGKERGKREQQ